MSGDAPPASAAARRRGSVATTGPRHRLRTVARRTVVLAAEGSAVAAGTMLCRSRLLRWGATDDELRGWLPGDDLLPHAHLSATRGISVRREPAAVWPWIAQLGQGRGGFYSYDGLENLARCDMHSADRVVPEWQEVQAGDTVRLHPEVALAVAIADRGRALVLRGGVPMGSMPPPYDFTWAFALRQAADGGTRLLVRERYLYTRPWTGCLVEPVAVVSFIMTRKMLRGIRDRAEAA